LGVGSTPVCQKKGLKETSTPVSRTAVSAPSSAPVSAPPHGIRAVLLSTSIGITTVSGTSNSGRWPVDYSVYETTSVQLPVCAEIKDE
jgi:hypothetical protein